MRWWYKCDGQLIGSGKSRYPPANPNPNPHMSQIRLHWLT